MDTIFFSYSRSDSAFVLKLAKDLRDAGVNVWLDQMDIAPGSHWDASIQKALQTSKTLLIILSSNSVASENVMDEVSYALEEGKRVIPILLSNCETPFRLRRLQRIDFTGEYHTGFDSLLIAVGAGKSKDTPVVETVTENIPDVSTPHKELVIKEVSKPPTPKIPTAYNPIQDETPSTIIEKPKSGSKKLIMIGGGVLVLVFIIFGIIKMTGGGDNKNDTSIVLDNLAASEISEIPIDTTVFYYIQNRSNDKVMTLKNIRRDDGSTQGYIVLASEGNEGSRKINFSFENGGIEMWVKGSLNWMMTDGEGILIEYYDKMEKVKNDIFQFINYKDGYFQITQPNINYVLGLQDLSAGSPDGQKITLVKNDGIPQTQWKLIPTGEKVPPENVEQTMQVDSAGPANH